MKQVVLNLVVSAILVAAAVFLLASPAEAWECWWCEHCVVTASSSWCCGGHWCCV